jgi:exodeoxyribonuclease V alpha subunit
MPNPLMSSRAREESGGYDANEPLATLECVLERITFHNAENGYSVVKVTAAEEAGPKGKGKTRAKDDVITVLGAFSNPVVGESLMCWGRWIKHPQYGSQFKLERYETIRPATANAIEKYLGSGMVKGVGPVMAKRIVAKFGEAALDVIEQTPDKLTQVSGIGEKRIEKITKAWEEQREVRNIMLFLQGHGVSPTYAVKIYRQYKERSIEVVERNPYQLATDIWGIGFKSADKIAQNVGIAPDAPERLEAGLIYVLNQEMEGGGHCFLLEDDLIKKAAEILLPQTHPDGDEEADKTAVDRVVAIERTLGTLVDRELLIAETVEFLGTRDTAIYTPSIHTTEKAVAERVNTLLNSPWRSRPKPAEIDAVVAGISGYDVLSDEQKDAVRRALSEPLLVLTGGPGVGKTFTTKVIVAAFEKLGRRLQIASPTGRAAKRASEVTGKEAKTIHRLLAFDPEKKGFKHGPGEPLELDVLIVDESSMLDLVLTHHTLRAVPDGAQIIFVGDVDQLPSVGPGNVLNDLIQSGRVPVARLTQVFRQAAESKIITNAHSINKGKMPDLLPPSAVNQGADCVFLEVEESEEIPTKIAAVVAKSLPKLGYTPQDITVLAPMQRGTVGARHLNEVLQGVLNPPRPDKAEYQRGPLTFRVGDRVMQRVNNYDKNVFNGDVGHITEIDKENQTVGVMYPEGPIEYDFPDMDQLNHASCVSIHKSQGSEYPACIIAIHTSHYMMLQRNLIYTALTRAKKIAVFVGSKRAIQMAVRNRNVVPRNTRLAQRLQMLVDDLGPDGRARTRPGGDRKVLPTPPMPGRLF